jgi:hypothetical protein
MRQGSIQLPLWVIVGKRRNVAYAPLKAGNILLGLLRDKTRELESDVHSFVCSCIVEASRVSNP